MINDFFDHIFCINLAKRPEKKEQAIKEFAAHGIIVEFVEGIDGTTLAESNHISKDGQPVSRGDRGCVLSHMLVASLAKERGYKNYFVFEDDAELICNFAEMFNKIISQMPANWDMIYLGGNHENVPTIPISENIVKTVHTYTTHAIGVNSTIYDKFIQVLSPADEKVDISITSLHESINCYCFNPHIAFQRPGFSDILEKETDYRHLRNTTIVPLGLRCSAATVVKKLGKRKQALPFDWIDLPLTAVYDLIGMAGDIESYVRQFISEVRFQRHKNGAWFPHDFVTTDDDYEIREKITEKFVRRFKRLYNLFESKDNLVFVTVISDDEDRNVELHERIANRLISICNGTCMFITINLEPHKDNYLKIGIGGHSIHYNFNVPFNDNWDEWENDICKVLTDDEHTKKWFI